MAACLLLILLTGLVLGRVWGGTFLTWDDNLHVYQNERFQPVTAQNVWYFWSMPFRERSTEKVGRDRPPYEQLWQPVPFTLWAVLSTAWQLEKPVPMPGGEGETRLNPFVFHFASWAVHCANVLLVFFFLLKLVHRVRYALVGAVPFAIHPVQVESVAWITQFNNLISVFFGLISLIFVLQLAKSLSRASSRLNPGFCWLAATLSFALACLSKPGLCVLPALAAVLVIWQFPAQKKKVLLSLLPWFLMAVVVLVVNKSLQGPDDQGLYVEPWRRLFQAGDALAFYVWKLVFPYAQAVDYARHSNYIFRHWWGYATTLVPLVWCWLAYRYRKGFPEFSVGSCLFVLAALPTIGLVPYYYHWYSTVSDRYVYFAMVGCALAAAGGARLVAQSSQGLGKVVPLLASLVGCWWGVQTWRDAGHWRDTPSLWSHVIQVTPRSWLARGNLGNYWQKFGDLEQAVQLYRAALELNPTSTSIRFNYALCLERLGREEEAYQEMVHALRDSPDDSAVLNSLAAMTARRNQVQESEGYFRRAMAADASNLEPLINLGVLLAMNQRRGEAILLWHKALQIGPDNPELRYNLGIAYEQVGKLELARAQWKLAVAARPDYELPALALQRASRKKEPGEVAGKPASQ